jgi:hypothetical protein
MVVPVAERLRVNSEPAPTPEAGKATRRGYGSGSLYQRGDNWYGRWHLDGTRVKRKLGPVRPEGTREGLTRAQAERELRRAMSPP